MLVFGKNKSGRYFIGPWCKTLSKGLHALNSVVIPSDSALGFYVSHKEIKPEVIFSEYLTAIRTKNLGGLKALCYTSHIES